MTDPPRSLQHPLGIEAVYWSPGAGTDLLVRVAGRWRRRRPATTVAPVLVVDGEQERHRFPALAEPPSLRGAHLGLWVVCFVVPASLAPYLAGRLTLMLGSVAISLPAAVADPGEPALGAGVWGAIPDDPDPIVITDRRHRRRDRAESEESRGQAGAEAAETAETEGRALLDWLEFELARAGRETKELRAELEVSERSRRQAEQLAHSEAQMRLDLGRDHAARVRRHRQHAGAVLSLLHAVQLRARGLASELDTLRRAADEAAHLAVVLTPGSLASPARGSRSRPRVLAAEFDLARSAPGALALPGTVAAVEPVGLELELAMRAARGRRRVRPPPRESQLAGALLRLAAERAQADDVLARGGDRERAQAAYVTEAIEAIACEIAAVRAAVALLPGAGSATGTATPAPGGARTPADARAPAAPRAPLGAPPTDCAPPQAGAPPSLPRPAGAVLPGADLGPALVAPARLAAALDRLRQELPPPEREHARDGARKGPARAAERTVAPPWLQRALRRLLREDAAIVGRIVIHLLPAQGRAVSGTLRYDIALGGGDCRAVTVTEGEVHLSARRGPRPLADIDFMIEGDLASLGRLLLYGSLRRRLSRRVARVRGNRRALAALERLVRDPGALAAWPEAGVGLEPELALWLAAGMIEPAWTAGERFAIGHQSPDARGRAYLLVRDGARPRVSRQPPLGPVATTIRSTGEDLLALLAAGSDAHVALHGEARPVVLLRDWIARAQRDS